ncbi:MAG: Uma2 family endonuclease [Deltaproteobacteria bacterium]|nr:Uma2 family endonuclease [Deltaproteobacteria bacterium]
MAAKVAAPQPRTSCPCAGYPHGADAATTAAQPDLLIVCDSNKIHRKVVRGAPDFVLAVASPANASHDHLRERRRYEQAGVRELWLVDPVERVLWAHNLTDAAYATVAVEELAGTPSLATLPKVSVDWDGAAAELPSLPAAPSPPTAAATEPQS